MKKLLLLLLATVLGLIAGCDREKYAQHRSERSKPYVAVTEHSVMVRRAPYPNLEILADGGLRVDDIAIPLKDEQREVLKTSFVKLQILRQNTLTDAPGTGHYAQIVVPEDVTAFPPNLPELVPEFKRYGEALGNLRAER